QPDGRWKFFTGVVSADSIRAVMHGNPTLSGRTVEKFVRRGPVSLSSLQAMSTDELRGVLRSTPGPLPTGGTVVGMTVSFHLTDHHGFTQSQIAGLSEAERHQLHQLAHNLEDGRVTATTRRRTV